MLDARLLKLPVASHQHCHEHHQIVVGVRGEANLSIDGNGSHLDDSRACLVPTEARHDYCGDNRNHVLVIDLNPRLPAIYSPANAAYDRLAPLFERPRTLHLDNRLQGMIQFAASEFDRAPANDVMKHHLAASILHCMAERLNERPKMVSSRHAIRTDQIKHYILNNLHRKIRVRDLAAVACLSASRFHEIFRDATGVTPHQFLLQTRLERASQLLVSTTLPIAEVGYRTGFSSQSALTNALRKHRDTTPTQLRFGEKIA